MPTSPKSFGLRSRANIIREPTRNRRLAPWAQSLARLPRIIFSFRSCIVFTEFPRDQTRCIATAKAVEVGSEHVYCIAFISAFQVHFCEDIHIGMCCRVI